MHDPRMVPVPRWLADAVQAIALVWGDKVTAERLGVPRQSVARLAAMLPVRRETLDAAIASCPDEYRPR